MPAPSGAATPDAQTTKKKSRKKNKKKTVEPDAATEPAKSTMTGETARPPSTDGADEPIADNDPFATQLAGIDAIKRGEVTTTDAQDMQSQYHADISKTVSNISISMQQATTDKKFLDGKP